MVYIIVLFYKGDALFVSIFITISTNGHKVQSKDEINNIST